MFDPYLAWRGRQSRLTYLLEKYKKRYPPNPRGSQANLADMLPSPRAPPTDSPLSSPSQTEPDRAPADRHAYARAKERVVRAETRDQKPLTLTPHQMAVLSTGVGVTTPRMGLGNVEARE